MLRFMNYATASDARYAKVMAVLGAVATVAAAAIDLLLMMPK